MRRKRLRDNGAILSGISVRSKCDANWLQSSVEYIYIRLMKWNCTNRNCGKAEIDLQDYFYESIQDN